MRKPAPSLRRVYLGMPGYGLQTPDAGRAFWRASRLPEIDLSAGDGPGIAWDYRGGSLLAANFNTLWANALNVAHRGGRLDYFAMQHADIGAPDWWLDAAIDELETSDLDVLGVVVPIKDMRGMTSLALARDDGDDWRPLCRLTMAEVHRLPATFTSADVGHPLLLNTGLWVCRFDPAWARHVNFTINDRIVFDRTTDRYLAQTEPEDWRFSRLLHEIGAPGSPTDGLRPLRIGCTRKIPVRHRGDIDFASDRVWGEPFDSSWVAESQVPDDLPGFRFPHDVNGWLRVPEGRELARLAKGNRVLEIGSYLGASTVCLAQTAARVVSVDTHDGRGTMHPADTFEPFVANLNRYGVDRKVAAIVGTVDALEDFYEDDPFDLVFIDGGHDAESVAHDIARARELLAPGGVIAFHDYRSNEPAVTAAVDGLILAGGRLVSLTDSLAVVTPPALQPLALEV